MITSVRIAPMEQWCELAKSYADTNPAFIKLVGRVVPIITESCRANESGCSSQFQWRVPDEFAKIQFDEIGMRYNPLGSFWICSSMLEMD